MGSAIFSSNNFVSINHRRKVYPAPKNELGDCSICLEELKSSVYATKCGHYFHTHCMYRHDFTCKHADRDTLCPLCRRKLKVRRPKKRRRRR